MQTQTMNETTIEKKVFIKMVLDAWETHNAKFHKLLDKLTDEELLSETAPGRNRGIYLVGHLIAVNDAMMPVLGFGEKLYPQLEKIFLSSPDKSDMEMPSMEVLKKYATVLNTKLSYHIGHVPADEWFAKHAVVSTEDFAKEPHRNKLNILVNRTNHLNYHLGQLAFLVKKG